MSYDPTQKLKLFDITIPELLDINDTRKINEYEIEGLKYSLFELSKNFKVKFENDRGYTSGVSSIEIIPRTQLQKVQIQNLMPITLVEYYNKCAEIRRVQPCYFLAELLILNILQNIKNFKGEY